MLYKRPDQQDLTVQNIKLSYQETKKSCEKLLSKYQNSDKHWDN